MAKAAPKAETKEPADDHIAKDISLPPWAVMNADNRMVLDVDPDVAYPVLLKEIGSLAGEVGKDGKPTDFAKKYDADLQAIGEDGTPTKWGVEVAYQCVKMDLQDAMGHFGFSIHILGGEDRKERWALANLPGDAKDVKRATNGLGARDVYVKLRGAIPA